MGVPKVAKCRNGVSFHESNGRVDDLLLEDHCEAESRPNPGGGRKIPSVDQVGRIVALGLGAPKATTPSHGSGGARATQRVISIVEGLNPRGLFLLCKILVERILILVVLPGWGFVFEQRCNCIGGITRR